MFFSGLKKRRRFDRGAGLQLPPGRIDRALAYLRRRDVLVRLALCLVTVAATWVVAGGWTPPFAYRTGYVPERDILARMPFKEPDLQATEDARAEAARQVRYVYTQNPEPLVQLRAALRNTIVEVTGAAKLADLGPEVWTKFQAPAAPGKKKPSAAEQEAEFKRFRDALAGEGKLADFEKAIHDAFATFEMRGLLEKLPPEQIDGNQEEIQVHPLGDPQSHPVPIKDVLVGDASALRKKLAAQLKSPEVAERVFNWLRPRLPSTLVYDKQGTQRAREDAATSVPVVLTPYAIGQPLAKAGEPLGAEQIQLLRSEHAAAIVQLSPAGKVLRSAATIGVILMLYVLCGIYVFYREHRLHASLRGLSAILAMAVGTVALCRVTAADAWRAEVAPLMLFAMTVAIAYQRELALLLSAAVSLGVVLTLGQSLGAFIVLMGTVTPAVLLSGCIRSRRKLIKVGLFTGLLALLLTLAVGILAGQPLTEVLLRDAAWAGLCALVAGFLMTGLLPFIESLFGVVTDISLLELGDAGHPLLQELIRRAPGTYNHSINVGSIAENAAESIGARRLLVRVGAYFHDLGKMLKPGYFIENQGQEANRHESLVPAMSTLIIIAHIKDGSDLARQHHLPQPVIDFIEQHHGTTVVEYFYHRASEQSEANPDAAEVEEHSFRYPGPKPQTKEASVLMLADAVEGASRTLVDPTPSRIESLVNDIAMSRLLDGQFDESGLTLQELRTIQDSLVKSLIAVYHGRVKYPEKRPVEVS
ncbi:MAG: HD family phosphohydrolase [Pirellulales bacterium]